MTEPGGSWARRLGIHDRKLVRAGLQSVLYPDLSSTWLFEPSHIGFVCSVAELRQIQCARHLWITSGSILNINLKEKAGRSYSGLLWGGGGEMVNKVTPVSSRRHYMSRYLTKTPSHGRVAQGSVVNVTVTIFAYPC